MRYNDANSFLFVKGVEINKFKAKDSETNAVPLSLGNVSKDFSADNMKRLDYMNMYIVSQMIMIVLMLLIF